MKITINAVPVLFALIFQVCQRPAAAGQFAQAPERLAAAAEAAAAAVRAGDYAAADKDLSALFSGGRAAETPVVYLGSAALPARSVSAAPSRVQELISGYKSVPAVSAPAAADDGGNEDGGKDGKKPAAKTYPVPEPDLPAALGAICLLAVALSGGTAALFFLALIVLAS